MGGDEADVANDYVQRVEQSGIAQARKAAAMIPAGTKGRCAECGEKSARLVNRWCAPCRDHYNKTHSRRFQK